jgi:hypothetical protein
MSVPEEEIQALADAVSAWRRQEVSFGVRAQETALIQTTNSIRRVGGAVSTRRTEANPLSVSVYVFYASPFGD